MKILAIFIAAAAAASAARPSYLFDSDYHDEPRFFESPPPPPPSARASFHGSYKRYESFPRNFQTFHDESSVLRPSAADYRDRQIFFDAASPSSPYFSRRQPQFYKDALTRFREGNDISLEYKGPPPPAPSDLPQKQTSPEVDGRPNDSPELQTTMAYHEPRGQQPTATMEHRQPLSFGGHSNHLNFGNHGLGFASVAAVTSTDINPLAVTEITATTRAAAAGPSTLSMHSASTSPHQISRQQLATNPPSTESPTSASPPPTPSPKIAGAASTGSSPNTASTSNNLVESTTPSATTNTVLMLSKSEMNMIQNSPNQVASSTVVHQEAPKMTYDYMSVMQEFPPVAHGQLPIESYRPMIVPDVKQNLLVYEVKGNFPFSQQQGNSNNVAPVRFGIPTVSIPTTSSVPTAGAPVKLEIQGMNFMQTPLALTAAPSNNAPVPLQRDMTQYAQSAISTAQQVPIFYTLQNQEQTKAVTTSNSNIPLGSFYVVPNSNQQAKQPIQHFASGMLHTHLQQHGINAPDLQLQLGNGFGGIEYLTTYGNSAPSRPAVIENGKISLNLDNLQSSEPTYTNVGFGHGFW